MEYICDPIPRWIAHVEKHEAKRGFGSPQFWNVSVLEEYNGHRRPGHIRVVHILHILRILRILHISPILHILHILDNLKLFFTECLDTCQSTIVYERRENEQVLYVVPVYCDAFLLSQCGQ